MEFEDRFRVITQRLVALDAAWGISMSMATDAIMWVWWAETMAGDMKGGTEPSLTRVVETMEKTIDHFERLAA